MGPPGKLGFPGEMVRNISRSSYYSSVIACGVIMIINRFALFVFNYP